MAAAVGVRLTGWQVVGSHVRTDRVLIAPGPVPRGPIVPGPVPARLIAPGRAERVQSACAVPVPAVPVVVPAVRVQAGRGGSGSSRRGTVVLRLTVTGAPVQGVPGGVRGLARAVSAGRPVASRHAEVCGTPVGSGRAVGAIGVVRLPRVRNGRRLTADGRLIPGGRRTSGIRRTPSVGRTPGVRRTTCVGRTPDVRHAIGRAQAGRPALTRRPQLAARPESLTARPESLTGRETLTYRELTVVQEIAGCPELIGQPQFAGQLQVVNPLGLIGPEQLPCGLIGPTGAQVERQLRLVRMAGPGTVELFPAVAELRRPALHGNPPAHVLEQALVVPAVLVPAVLVPAIRITTVGETTVPVTTIGVTTVRIPLVRISLVRPGGTVRRERAGDGRPVTRVDGPGQAVRPAARALLQQRREPLGVLGVHAEDDPGPPPRLLDGVPHVAGDRRHGLGLQALRGPPPLPRPLQHCRGALRARYQPWVRHCAILP